MDGPAPTTPLQGSILYFKISWSKNYEFSIFAECALMSLRLFYISPTKSFSHFSIAFNGTSMPNYIWPMVTGDKNGDEEGVWPPPSYYDAMLMLDSSQDFALWIYDKHRFSEMIFL